MRVAYGLLLSQLVYGLGFAALRLWIMAYGGVWIIIIIIIIFGLFIIINKVYCFCGHCKRMATVLHQRINAARAVRHESE